MARKTADVTISADGRDAGKTFRLTEMAARSQVDWCVRAVAALGAAGIVLPANWQDMSAEIVLAEIGFSTLGRVAPEASLPLMDELMACVRFVSSAGVERALQADDIEEAKTYFKLYDEVGNLHLGFFIGEKARTLVSVLLAMLNWSVTPTSPEPLEA